MKYIYLLTLGILSACNSSQKTTSEQSQEETMPANPVVYAETITADELKEHLYIYASDEFEGRETGEPGQKLASEYIQNTYKTLGVAAAMDNKDYYQEVPLEIAKLPTGSITIADQVYVIGEDFLCFRGAEEQFSEILYLGYGIDSDSYSDYDGKNVKGKVILVKAGEPKNEDGTYKVSGSSKKSAWGKKSESIEQKLNAAKENGVAAMLYLDPSNYGRYRGYYNYMKSNADGRMDVKNTGNNSLLVMLDEEMASSIHPEIEESDAFKTISASTEINLESTNTDISSENVISIIPGTDKADEYVIISSHLDHIGVSSNGKINNGADDDGSGTVAMLEIAEAFKTAVEAGHGPKRSIVFLHVTGEEKGLLGSQYYTDVEPVFPLEKTVANLNIDMIGRIDPKRDGDRNYVYLIGSDKLSTDLHLLSEEVNNKYTQIELDYTYNDENDPNRFYYRSDHYNFAKNNIPIIFYFNGTHADYHRPGDTPDKINYDLLENRSRLIFHTAWEVANRDERVVVDKAAK